MTDEIKASFTKKEFMEWMNNVIGRWITTTYERKYYNHPDEPFSEWAEKIWDELIDDGDLRK